MTCLCPKCHVQIEVDLSRIPENGTFMPCSECKGRFWVNKESYARMALNKEGQIYCDQCGKELDHKIVCAACGVMYPDYYLVQASKPPRRQIEKGDLFSLPFLLKPASPTYTTSSHDYSYSSATKSSGWAPKVNLQKVGAIAVVLLIAASLGFYYHIKQVEQRYAQNYMRALYAIKTGTDLSLSTCVKISEDWRSKMTSGNKYIPQISVEDESRLNKVKNATDKYMQLLNPPPKRFINNKNKLANLYNIYTKAYALAIDPSGSLSGFTNAAAKSQSDFNSALSALKENMPRMLSKEFQIAKTKYRGLENI